MKRRGCSNACSGAPECHCHSRQLSQFVIRIIGWQTRLKLSVISCARRAICSIGLSARRAGPYPAIATISTSGNTTSDASNTAFNRQSGSSLWARRMSNGCRRANAPGSQRARVPSDRCTVRSNILQPLRPERTSAEGSAGSRSGNRTAPPTDRTKDRSMTSLVRDVVIISKSQLPIRREGEKTSTVSISESRSDRVDFGAAKTGGAGAAPGRIRSAASTIHTESEARAEMLGGAALRIVTFAQRPTPRTV